MVFTIIVISLLSVICFFVIYAAYIDPVSSTIIHADKINNLPAEEKQAYFLKKGLATEEGLEKFNRGEFTFEEVLMDAHKKKSEKEMKEIDELLPEYLREKIKNN